MNGTEPCATKPRSLWLRALTLLTTELVEMEPQLRAYNLAMGLLPRRNGAKARVKVLRALGFTVGSGTEIKGPLKLSGARGIVGKLRIGQSCNIDAECTFEVSDALTIGDRVTIEPGVMILTSTHELDFSQHRAGKLVTGPVSIGAGAWLRARAIILPGVEIGTGAVVDAGAIVDKNVADHTRVGGMPAAPLEVLRKSDEA
jgi:acetyltransferase-like isoleucine patch superfamily enzyme